jgi:hypothetical protein
LLLLAVVVVVDLRIISMVQEVVVLVVTSIQLHRSSDLAVHTPL